MINRCPNSAIDMHEIEIVDEWNRRLDELQRIMDMGESNEAVTEEYNLIAECLA